MRKIKKSFFTLLEVLVSMGVFSLLMLALMQFFSAAQGVWERTGNKAELFESAKTTMDIIANDLTCAYYEQDYDASQFQFFKLDSGSPEQIAFAVENSEGKAAVFYKWNQSEWTLHRVEKKEKDVGFSSSTINPEVIWEGEKKTGWFTRSGNTDWIGNSGIAGTTLKAENCLAENVLDFSIKGFAKDNLSTAISSSLTKPLPDIIIISMIMLSGGAHEKLLTRLTDDAGIRDFFEGTAANSTFVYIKPDGTESSDKKSVKDILNAGCSLAGSDDTTQMILFNGCQRFTRVIPLDRGQND